METLTISKPGKTKHELLDALQKLLDQYKGQLSEYNGEVTEITDGYKIHGTKFIFYIDGEIIAEDGKYNIKYDSNAPQNYVEKGLEVVKATLNSV